MRRTRASQTDALPDFAYAAWAGRWDDGGDADIPECRRYDEIVKEVMQPVVDEIELRLLEGMAVAMHRFAREFPDMPRRSQLSG